MNTHKPTKVLAVIAIAMLLSSCELPHQQRHKHSARGVILQSYMGYSAWSGEICFSSVKLIDNSAALKVYGVCGKVGDTVRVYDEQCASVCDKCQQFTGTNP